MTWCRVSSGGAEAALQRAAHHVRARKHSHAQHRGCAVARDPHAELQPVRAEQTTIGIFWAYDGALRIGVPPRLYAQNIDVIIEAERKRNPRVLPTALSLVQLYAMTHVAMADATITVRPLRMPPSAGALGR
jgi:hypothetical protein